MTWGSRIAGIINSEMGTRNLMALVKQRSLLPPPVHILPCCHRFMSSGDAIQSESRPQKQKIAKKESIGDAKIRILVKSFSQKYLNHPCFQSYRKVGLPRRRVLYTVLRSPHIDKKSREQFETRVHKQLLEKDVDVNEMAKMFFWFKRMHFFGAQYEFIFNYKTRLDMTRGMPSIHGPQGCWLIAPWILW
ncbi:small ribosomal subunit protein uS10m isoform X2 [Cryptomeria japonica]|uniref:small ribosomal subunit protein uS10m isoform X2 n=1 Tax=Cryptomeria japonica TaxID=3369 RepID=UPI0027DA7C35|nr:small ribosomal subunit protein uS10m isoform X2 [Cryptomeria japonica]